MHEEISVNAPETGTLHEHAPRVIPHAEHGISRRDIDPFALKVLYRLARNGFTGYLVGGGVRDLLLKRKPKDFDISTNARPEQIKSLFRNCLLIGRRFRLAHIRYGDKIIETSTFRRTPDSVADPNDPEADLFQRDDNLFGSPEEDALRRDFTVNGLFYNIEDFSVIDYVDGINDLEKRLVRSIGDPNIRFREDPVRMIRAVRFASRLNFSIDPEDLEAMRRHREEIAKASPARLLEEISRLFAFSSGEKAVALLESTGILEVVLPEIAAYLSNQDDASLFWRRLSALDQGDTVLQDATQPLIFAALFSDPLRAVLDSQENQNGGFRRRFERMRSYLDNAAGNLAIPRKLKEKIFRIIGSQSRFANPAKRRVAEAMVKQDWFPEALALAEIAATVEGRPPAELNPWRDMFADTLCVREENRGRSGNGRHGHKNGPGGDATRDRNDDDLTTETQAAPADHSEQPGQPGHGLSRSARRRRNRQRNKERRKQEKTDGHRETQHPGTEAAPPATGSQTVAAERSSPAPQTIPAPVAAPAAPEEKSVSESSPAQTNEPAPKGRRRGTAKGKNVQPAPQKQSPEEEKPAKSRRSKAKSEPESSPAGPLTAASFYTKPAVPANDAANDEAAAKKNGRRKRGQAQAQSPSQDKSEPALRTRDRSEEANLPMHWLDEI